jgi:hypothetical protein
MQHKSWAFEVRGYLGGTPLLRLESAVIEERLSVDAYTRRTNFYTYDSGQSRKAGVLTKVATNASSSDWSGTTDGFARVGVEANSTVRRAAYGRINGPATVKALTMSRDMSTQRLMRDRDNDHLHSFRCSRSLGYSGSISPLCLHGQG